MDFSIIIVSYNTAQMTKDCIESIFLNCHKENFEIIVVDNNSKDGSVKILKKAFSGKIKLIENKENLGFAGANNQGAQLARGKYLFFLNSDTKISDNILGAIKTIFASNPSFKILSPLLLNPKLKPQLGAYGKFPTLAKLITRQTKENWKEEINENLWQTDWVSGAALIIEKELFNKIGGWDKKFFLYFEDVDLCLQAKKQGAKIGVCPQAKIVHLGGQSLKQSRKRKYYYYKSQNYFFSKHYGWLKNILMRLIRWPYKLYSYWIK